MRIKSALAALVVPCSLFGCVDPSAGDAGDDDQIEPDGVSYDFSVGWAYSATTNATGDERIISLGSDQGRFCFLSGISGKFAGASGLSQVLDGEDGWELHFSSTAKLKVYARCVSAGNGALSTRLRVIAYHPAVTVAPVTANRQCFFTGLGWDISIDSRLHGFSSASDQLAFANDGVNWSLPANLPINVQVQCVSSQTGEGSFTVQAPASGTNVVGLPSVSGTTCGMQGLGGPFNGTDVTDGAWIDKDDNSNYEATATNGKRIIAGCLK